MGIKSKFAIIGIFVLLSIFTLIWGLNYLKGVDIFSHQNTYIALYEQVNGLGKSSPILLSGYKVGNVKEVRINFDNIGVIDVVLGIEPKLNIPKGTVARIVSTDLMGTKAIELEFSDNLQYHKIGDTLTSDTEESLQEQVSIQMLPLKHKAEDLLSEMEAALKLVRLILNEETQDKIQKTFSHISSSTNNIKHITTMLDTIVHNQSGNIQSIISNIKSLTDNLKYSNREIRQIITNINRTTDSMSNMSFARIIDNIDKTMESLKTTMEKLDNGVGTIGQMMQNDTLYNSLVETSHTLNQLLNDLNKNPKKYLNFRVFDFSKDAK